jgi:hypothetical protein
MMCFIFRVLPMSNVITFFSPPHFFILKDSSSPESLIAKASWMAFLLFLFYISFEIFLRLNKSKRTMEAGYSEL